MKARSFSRLLPLCALLAAGCGGGTPSTNDTVVADTPTDEAVTLTGIVTDNPIVNASVAMSVGGNSFDAGVPTGTRGDFQIRIASEDPLALVTAEARDTVNGVTLAAILDTFEGCVELANNGIVDDVLITNVTTAQKVLAERLATDGSIDTFAEFQGVAEGIDTRELLDLAAALKVVIENIDGNTLPAGYADTLALARDIAAGGSSFVNDLGVSSPTALATARTLLLTDGNATVPVRAASATGVYLADEFVYAFFDNGTALADFFEDRLVPGTPSWSLDALGRLNVTFYGFTRERDSLSVLGSVGDTMHVVANLGAQDESGANLVSSNVRKYEFGGAFDSAGVVGTWADPATPDAQWVFEAAGNGYRRNGATMVQSDPFAWSVTSDGRLRIAFDDFDEVLDIVMLDTGSAPMVLNISRFANQWSTLNVGGFARSGS